jgi:hypothetical protein
VLEELQLDFTTADHYPRVEMGRRILHYTMDAADHYPRVEMGGRILLYTMDVLSMHIGLYKLIYPRKNMQSIFD